MLVVFFFLLLLSHIEMFKTA